LEAVVTAWFIFALAVARGHKPNFE